MAVSINWGFRFVGTVAIQGFIFAVEVGFGCWFSYPVYQIIHIICTYIKGRRVGVRSMVHAWALSLPQGGCMCCVERAFGASDQRTIT